MRFILVVITAFVFNASVNFGQDGSSKNETQGLTVLNWPDDKYLDGRAHSYESFHPRKPTPSAQQLREAIQQKRGEVSYCLFAMSETDLRDKGRFLSVLELTADQIREYKKCVEARREDFNELNKDAQSKLKEAKSKDEHAPIVNEHSDKVTELAKDLIKDFKTCLVPYQVERLDDLLSGFEFQCATEVCLLHKEVSMNKLSSVYLDLSSEEEVVFNEKSQEAIAEYLKRIEAAKEELRDDMVNSVPESKRTTYDAMIGENPTWFVRQLKLSMMVK